MPLGAYGGKREIMQQVAPTGPVYQAGTLSGNPVAVAAGLCTLSLLRDPEIYTGLESRCARFEQQLRSMAEEQSVRCCINRVASMITVFFGVDAVHSWREASQNDQAQFKEFHRVLMEHGVYWPPSSFEAAFISNTHTDEVFAEIQEAFRAAFKAVAELARA